MKAVQVGIAKAGQVVDRLRALQSRPDFRRSPWKAAAKRIIWRARRLLWTDPWELRMRGGLRIMVPRSGASAPAGAAGLGGVVYSLEGEILDEVLVGIAELESPLVPEEYRLFIDWIALQ